VVAVAVALLPLVVMEMALQALPVMVAMELHPLSPEVLQHIQAAAEGAHTLPVLLELVALVVVALAVKM
jgi:hypothetical protein